MNKKEELELTGDDYDFILTSLDFTRQAFENYSYPTYEFKLEQLKKVKDIIAKIRQLGKELK